MREQPSKRAELTTGDSPITPEYDHYDHILTDTERAELQQLQNEAARLNLIVLDNGTATRYIDLEVALRYNMIRTNELLTGYPQTGSVGSITFVRERSHERNEAYRLERRINYFNSLLNRSVNPIERHEASFGSHALPRKGLLYYIDRESRSRSDSSPIAVGHIDLATDDLVSYMLVLCESNPHGKTALERYLPEGALYLDGIFVADEARGQRLAGELMDDLIDEAYGRGPILWSVLATNQNMMRALSRMGERHRDKRYLDGPQAGRSRAIELMYWNNYFGNGPYDGRTIMMYDLGLLIPDWIIQKHETLPLIEPEDVGNFIGREAVAFSDRPIYDSNQMAVNASSITHATAQLLNSGYIGIPLPKRRLYVHREALPGGAAHIIQDRCNKLDEIREEDMSVHMGHGVLKALRFWKS